MLEQLRARTQTAELACRTGRVRAAAGDTIECDGPDATLGELCTVRQQWPIAPALAEVVALRRGQVTLMPLQRPCGIREGSRVEATGHAARVPVGRALLGRVIDGFGSPLDGLPPPAAVQHRDVRAAPRNPLQRPRIGSVLQTGVRAIDLLLTLGRGQRIGIFAGSGVGKSTLLGHIARNIASDVAVIALIGERGREVQEFIDQQLGPQGLARSVVVVAPADQPAPGRVHATHAAFTIAEAFRDAGLQVTLLLDSVTRYAMARREIGLAAGEPPTARGYTPSVFSALPELCERAGTAASGGSITALLTVLVEGDDLDEPIADTLRAVLDGHIVLSRDLAQQGWYPAIDVRRSTSRVMEQIVSHEELALARRTVALIDLLERSRPLVEIGAHAPGSRPELDAALRLQPELRALLCQGAEATLRGTALAGLRALWESHV